MALSVEKLLNDAHTLILRLKDHDSMADSIIGSTQALFLKVEAMKQYQDDITELNEIAKHRPRSTLVLGIAQENRQIRELQQENRELQATLEDHQSALELIMQKYREHTVKLLQSNRMEKAIQEKELTDKNSMCHLMDKIDEMAGVMQKAIEVDETTGCVDKERLSQLEVENRALRELLEICTTSRQRIIPVLPEEVVTEDTGDKAIPPDGGEEEEEDEDTANEEDEETDSSESNSTIIMSPPVKKEAEETTEEKKGSAAAAKKSPEKQVSKEKDSPSSPSGATGKAVKAASQTKSASDLKKTKSSLATTVKRTTSNTVVKKDSAAAARKSPSTETKKDSTIKAKPAATKANVKK